MSRIRDIQTIFLSILLLSAASWTQAGEPAKQAAPRKSTTSQPTAAKPRSYKESPVLAEQVKAGKLPPVEQRLPENPLVVKAEKVGVYGGTWRMGQVGGSDSASYVRTFASDGLVRWKVKWDGIEPNLAEKYEVNKDATEYVFHLRKGLKWSDGRQFTADDILFWYEDCALNKDLIASPPAWLKAGGEVGKITKLDSHIVKFSFAKPYGLFLQVLATPDVEGMTSYAKHYAQQFHSKYTDQAKLDEMVKAAGFKTWKELFEARVGRVTGDGVERWQAAGRPTLYPWVTEQPAAGNATQVTFIRNPYYFKVDQDGQQYPYIDRLVYTVYQDIPAMLLKATNGEIDFQMRHFNTLDNKAVLFDNQQKGGYRFVDLTDAGNNKIVISLNLTHKDKALRSLFQKKEFRIGLSHAINRKEIIDTVYVGQGKPFQPAPLEGTPFYNKQFATQYLEFDVARANAYLDKAGLRKGPDGMRLREDGKPVSFVLEVNAAARDQVDAANLITKYWKAVGIAAETKSEDRSLLYERKNNNDLDAMIWQGEGGVNPILDARSYFPWSIESPFAVAWALWYQQLTGSVAEEPPAAVKKLMDKYDQVKATPSFDGQIRAMRELLQMSAEQFFCIGVSTPPDQYGITKIGLGNVPARMIFSWAYPTPGPTNPFAYFFAK